ncbi:MAG: CBS domain-containing protein [Actinobacteria bacterium]|nr:CBS domain-containing protein [Actinomycetota bacterium]
MSKKITKVQELIYKLKIEQAMTKGVIKVHPKTVMGELREILKNNRISGIPVMDEDKLVGIISIEDFIKCMADGKLDAFIEDRMTKDVEILYADEPLIHAVNKFNKFGFGRFPVIERGNKKLVGIITKSDIIKTLLKELEINLQEEEIHRYRASHIFEDMIANKTTLIFEYNVAGQDFKRAGESASELKKSLGRLGINPQILRRVAIATYEAEMNMVIFTSGGRITAYIKPDEIRVKAIDSGPGIPDIEQAMQPGFSTAPPMVQEWGFGAGMGLPNIKKCADKMNINSIVGKGTKLEIVIYTHRKNETQTDS